MKHQKMTGWLGAGVLLSSLLAATQADAIVLYRLPLSSDTSVHYYYDQNSSSGVTAWNCSGNSYNGHRGTDFSGGPRGRAIYGGAVGTLSYKIDGFGDGYAGSPDGGGFGNYVKIAHAEGMATYYGHMTVGSVTGKAVGSSIACSEQVGGVGTSGSSTGLHLHFEPRLNGVGDDPFSGSCGGPISWWVNQNGGNPTTTCQGGTPPPTKTARNVENTSATYIGTWATGTSAPDKSGADYRYKSTAPVSEPATFSTTLNVTATWNVKAWWPQGANRSATAPYVVSHSGGTTTVNKNQQANGGSWQTLGSWSMGGAQTVKLSVWTTTGFIVVADAVRWD